MKRVSIAIIAILCAVQAARAEDPSKLCSGIAKLAESTMLLKQRGVPASYSLVWFEGDSKAAKMARELVIAAYKEPDFATDAVKEQQVAKFVQRMETECYTAE